MKLLPELMFQLAMADRGLGPSSCLGGEGRKLSEAEWLRLQPQQLRKYMYLEHQPFRAVFSNQSATSVSRSINVLLVTTLNNPLLEWSYQIRCQAFLFP